MEIFMLEIFMSRHHLRRPPRPCRRKRPGEEVHGRVHQEGSAARHQRAELRRSRLLSASQLRRTSDLSSQERVSLPAKLAQRTPSRPAASPPLPPSLQEEEATAAEKPELVKEKEPKRRASRASGVRRSLSCRPTLRLRRRGRCTAPGDCPVR